MKKILLYFVMMLLPMVASADAIEIDGIYYNIINKLKTAEVTSNPNKYVGNLTIPDKIIYEGTEYDVTSIGNAAFYKCSELTSIVIGNNVTTITNAAFTGCTGLNSISLGNSVTSIKYKAFYNCKSITSLTIPQSVNYIERDAFWGCAGLKEVHINDLESWCNISFDYASNPLEYAHHLFLNDEEIKSLVIPNNISSIGCYAFSGCIGLTDITIPNHFESINEGAFKGCEGLTSITIPNGVKTIESGAFQGCTGLTSITIPSNVEVIGGSAFSGCSSLNTLNLSEGLISIGSFAFEGCTGIKSLTIPNSVTSIGEWSFSVCEGLVSVSIGSGIKDIGGYAFGLCPELTDVYCFSKLVPTTNDDVFNKSFIEYATLHVPALSISLYQNAMPWKNFKEIVKIDMPIHILKYMIDGETYKLFEIEEGEAITAEPEPTKEGYTFSGWSDIPETMPAHDVTVTGSFTVNKYKLIYKVGGNEYKSYELEYGTTINTEPAPTKEGYTFSGWSEIPETMPAHDVTVTGTFTKENYKLTYMVDDEIYKTISYDYGDVIIPEPVPTKEGYTFSGWSVIPEIMPAHDITVTGTFSINSYKLTYMIDDKVYKETMYEYGAIIIPEPQPEGDYATFEWTDLPQTMPAHDVIVYASYTSGIIEVLMTTQRNIRIYSPNGKKLDKLQKGLNIVVLDDGTVKKVVVK